MAGLKFVEHDEWNNTNPEYVVMGQIQTAVIDWEFGTNSRKSFERVLDIIAKYNKRNNPKNNKSQKNKMSKVSFPLD